MVVGWLAGWLVGPDEEQYKEKGSNSYLPTYQYHTSGPPSPPSPLPLQVADGPGPVPSYPPAPPPPPSRWQMDLDRYGHDIPSGHYSILGPMSWEGCPSLQRKLRAALDLKRGQEISEDAYGGWLLVFWVEGRKLARPPMVRPTVGGCRCFGFRTGSY